MTAHPVIRPVQLNDVPAMARVHVDSRLTAYVGIVPDEYLANLSYERCQANWIEKLADPQNEKCTFVAETQAGQIVALASGGPLRDDLPGYDGELYVLYVLKAFQGMGCGRRLVAQVAWVLESRGCHSLVIWVLKNNPARRFYERLGGRLIGEKIVDIGGKPLVDVAYAWPDLSVFGQDEFTPKQNRKDHEQR